MILLIEMNLTCLAEGEEDKQQVVLLTDKRY